MDVFTADEKEWEWVSRNWLDRAQESALPNPVRQALTNWLIDKRELHQVGQKRMEEWVGKELKKTFDSYGGKHANDKRVAQNLILDLSEASTKIILQKQEESVDSREQVSARLRAALESVKTPEVAQVDPLSTYLYDESVGLFRWFQDIVEKELSLEVAVAWCATGFFEKRALETLWEDTVVWRKMRIEELERLPTWKGRTLGLRRIEDCPGLLRQAIQTGGLKFNARQKGALEEKSYLPAL